MNDITIVVPTFKLENERFDNFKFIVKRVCDSRIPVIIVEQTINNLPTNVLKYIKYLDKSYISYFPVLIDDVHMHKSKIVNVASSFIKTKYLWLVDADCYLKYEQVLKQVDNQDVIKPFKYVVHLNKSETQELFKHGQVHIKKETRSLVKQFGPLSFIIKKYLFEQIGGLNENFIGYGWEDLEFANRVKKKFKVDQINLNGVHLYHKKANEHENNKYIYKTLISSVENPSQEKNFINTNHLISNLTNKLNIEEIFLREILRDPRNELNIVTKLILQNKLSGIDIEKLIMESKKELEAINPISNISDVNSVNAPDANQKEINSVNPHSKKETNIVNLIKPHVKKEFKNLIIGKLIKGSLDRKININKLIEEKNIRPKIEINKEIIEKLIKQMYDTKNGKDFNVTKTKIIHTIAPALLESKKELYERELLTIESIINQKKKSGLDITTIIISNNPNAQKFKDDFIILPPLRTALEIGDKRDLPYLSDIFKIMSDMAIEDDVVLFYTNSDCCIYENTYQKLLKYEKHAIEYHRNDVHNDPKNLNDMFNNDTTIHKTGIDGLALTNVFYKHYKQYIVDFFIGEPHWDTAIGGFLRNFCLSTINSNDLFHPKHNVTWNTANLTPSGEKNTTLYKEFIEYGFLKEHILSLPDGHEPIDTNVVIVHFGNDPVRVNATTTALSWLAIQELPVEYIFVELVYNNDAGAFEYLKGRKNLKYIKLNGQDKNKVIWQKEAMMNIGAKACTKDYVIFLDSDIYSRHSNWFTRIRDHLKLNDNSLLQVFKLCTDSVIQDQIFVSMAAKWNQYDTDFSHNPGLGIATRRSILIKNKYFNPFCIYGSGDTCILAEYCKQDAFLFSYDKFKMIKRGLEIECNLDYIDEDVIHENHGELVSLNYYRDRHEVSKKFSKEIKDLVSFDSNGLLIWNNIDCEEKKLISELYKNKFK